MRAITGRLTVLWGFIRWITTQWVARAWAALGAWDLICSQWLPEAWLSKAPKARMVVEYTSGLPTWLWALVAASIVVWCAVEYAYRLNAAAEAAAQVQQPPEHVDLRKLGNRELRAKTKELVRQLRLFSINFETAVQKLGQSRSPVANDAERQARFHRENEALQRLYSQFSADFKTRYRGDAIALREEVGRRTGVFEGYRDDIRTYALDFGTLAGPNPVGELADYLDELARKLD